MQELSRPIPNLAPQPITFEQYEALTPEKLELWDGYLIRGPDEHAIRRDLLSLLLTNEGLEAAMQLAPVELWQAALRRVHGSP
ncbi:MAG: hypothetical protein M3021_03955 [Actinomycetota bacterium]|nr:hypothetical protein [Actinomycetota bacterium]